MDTCECVADGWCARYRREMVGRFRDICAARNCDIGTAASFRAQWAREASAGGPGEVLPTLAAHRAPTTSPPHHILLKTDQAPGDAVAMTAAIYSLHRAHPGKFLTSVESPYPEVFEHNPDIVPAAPGAALLHMHYPAISDSNKRAIHFMQGWCEFLGMALGVQVPLLTNRPHLYFAEPKEAREDFFEVEGKWLICSGGKTDFTNKLWGHDKYQDVVNRLFYDYSRGVMPSVQFVQVGANLTDHPPLRNVENMVGRTTLRGLFDFVRRARGVLCGVSLLMHVAAALEKPAVVIAGGREPVAWNAYPKQQYVHTVGALPCTSPQGEVGGACWRSRVVPIGEDSFLDRDPCLRPVGGVPECMRLIKPAEVAALVARYNEAYEHLPALL